MTARPDPFPNRQGAQMARLADGRLHLHHGPIDIIAKAWGDPAAVARGEAAAAARFPEILPELCAELPLLRAEATGDAASVKGPVARRMARAVTPFRPAFITPMAAVAGAVAEEVLSALVQPGVTRAYVNNGGDIALFLGPGESLTCALATRQGAPDRLALHARDAGRGIATSGWRGRSWSFGIADAVTVIARTAAMADAAATMIANAVDLPDHPGIDRQPAHSLQADSDLGPRMVTVGVPVLSAGQRAAALDRGLACAEGFRARGAVEGAALFLQGDLRVTGAMALPMDRNERAHV
jgi:ApbE superfamily uncharacterized protein (UPF0280 family)